MLDASIQVLLYGLLAGLSALAFTATLAVMPGGRLKTLSFGAGFVGAQTLTCAAFVTLGIGALGASSKNHPGLRAALAFALAIVLVALAVRVRRRPPSTNPRPPKEPGTREQALLERLGRLHVLTTFVAGLLLGVGGPKRLVVTSLAATTIVTAEVGDADKTALSVLYVAIATALVWIPALVFVLLGKRMIVLMKGAEDGVARRQPQITVYALFILAGLLIVDAVSIVLA